jgi:hypothetical protein
MLQQAEIAEEFEAQLVHHREGEVRRWAKRAGLTLQKARTRNRCNPSFGRYRLAMRSGMFRRTKIPVYGVWGDYSYTLTLDMVEDFLSRFCFW